VSALDRYRQPSASNVLSLAVGRSFSIYNIGRMRLKGVENDDCVIDCLAISSGCQGLLRLGLLFFSQYAYILLDLIGIIDSLVLINYAEQCLSVFSPDYVATD